MADPRLKKTTYRTPNRIAIDTGHCTFDRQADILTTGNVAGGIQFSSFVRPHTETQCNGMAFTPGNLRNFDLGPFRTLPSFGPVDRYLAQPKMRDRHLIVYLIRHWNGRKTVVHGYIVTGTDHRHVRTFHTSGREKSRRILETVRPYLAWGTDGREGFAADNRTAAQTP